MVTRLTNQKGLGLIRYAMDRLICAGIEVAVLGTGDAEQEDAMRFFDGHYGNRMAARI